MAWRCCSRAPKPFQYRKGLLLPGDALKETLENHRNPVSCLFCRIVAGTEERGASILYDDGVVAAFQPRTPDTADPKRHILVVPKFHVDNIHTLRDNAKTSNRGRVAAAVLLHHMRRVGHRLAMGEEADDLVSAVPDWLKSCADAEIAKTEYLSRSKSEGKELISRAASEGISEEHRRELLPPQPAEVSDLLAPKGMPFPINADQDPLHGDVDYGFHTPPYNTIDHLHLHVLGGHGRSGIIPYLTHMDGMPWHTPFDEALEFFRIPDDHRPNL